MTALTPAELAELPEAIRFYDPFVENLLPRTVLILKAARAYLSLMTEGGCE